MAYSRKLGGAATGAAIGAKIGTAISPGAGTAIGVGIGGLAGLIGTKGKTEYEESLQERLRYLERLDQLGKLGLTDKERRLLEENILSPISAQSEQARLATLSASAPQDIGAGAFFKAEQARQTAEQKAMAEGARTIAGVEEQRRQQRQQEINTLRQNLDIAGATDKQAARNAFVDFTTSVASGVESVYDRAALMEFEAAMRELTRSEIEFSRLSPETAKLFIEAAALHTPRETI